MLSRVDVIRMAREAGFEVGRDAGGEYVAPQYSDSVGTLVRLVKAAYAAWQAAERKTCEVACAQAIEYAKGAEREACAELCHQFAGLMRSGKAGDQLTDQLLDLQAKTGDDLAATIRARAENGGA